MPRLQPLRHAAVAMALALVLALPALTHAGPSERLAVQRLVAAQHVRPVVTSDPGSGAIVAIRGAAVPLPEGRARPGEAARAWVGEHAEAFGLRDGTDALEVERDEPLTGGAHRILLRQRWNGIPVEGGDARCIVDSEGRLRYIASGFLAGLDSPRDARVSSTRAIAVAADAARLSLASVAAEVSLWVRRRDGADRLAWGVRLAPEAGIGVLVWVDAVSGAVLALDRGCADAVGLVYPTDPRDAVAEMPLLRLLPSAGLTAQTFALLDIQYPQATPLGPDDDYRYPPSHPSFDQVNVYWHTDRFLHQFLGGLGYGGPPEPLIVRVNMPVEPFVAFTNGRYVYLGRPIAGFVQDVARSQDIIYHELSHAVIYGAGIGPTGPGREATALHEGLADYFAAALTGDPAIGEWLYLTFPNGATRVDQPAATWNYLRYDQVAFAGGDVGSPWGNGMILSSGLWDLRRELGPACDSLVLESLAYLPTAPVWAQFANALLQADHDHHAGRFSSAIIRVLLERVIRGAAVAAINGPSAVAPGDTVGFEAEPCCGGSFGAYHWRMRSWCRGNPCGEWRDAGDGVSLRLALDEDAELELTVTTPWGDRLTATRFVGVRLPSLVVDGPRRVARNTPATWKARFAAMGPAHVTWVRQWRRPGALPEPLGEDLERSFVADTSLDLTVTLRDGLGRTVTQRHAVETFEDRPPPLAPAVLRLTQSLDASARHAETRIELGRRTGLKLVIYDVRGSKRETVWDGPADRGVHVVRWDAGGLEPGVYFLRLLAEPAGMVRRFVIVR